jgi:exopolysaccharide production protein ExoQ
MAIGSYFVCLFVPSMGIHDDINAGAWRGLWYEKNAMAAAMVMGVIACISSALLVPKRNLVWLIAAGLMLGLILMSRSKTSLLAVSACLLAYPLYLVFRRGGIIGIISFWLGSTATLIGTAVIVLAPDVAYKILGKDPSLTGRTQIWESLLRLSAERPWLGYGYKAFWTPDSLPASIVRKETRWDVPTAHNGWLDLLVQLGWVGVIVFASILALGLIFALLRFDRVKDGFFSVQILGLFSLLILSESFILAQNSLIWALFVCAVTRLSANRLKP